MKKTISLLSVVLILSSFGYTQKKDKSMFKEYQPGYYQNVILKDISQVNEQLQIKEIDKRFEMDHSGLDLPNKINLYKTHWANPTVSQGNGGTCWAYSTISFYESEIFRISGGKLKVKLSEEYIAYCEYLEKAKRFVRERGNSNFDQGSEANAVTRILKQYGCMPYTNYTGLLHGRKFHTHEAMFNEMKAFLENLKKTNNWNEELVLQTIKNIMNHYIGIPPTEFVVDGKTYTPKTYVKDYLKLNPDDFVDIISYKQEPYWKKVEYKVPDNWWHNSDYHNVPVDIFMQIIKKSIRAGYTIGIGGDVSEAGFSRITNCAIVASFDIPSEYIDDDSRQFRFSNQSTTDDHGMHLIGYYEKDGKDWYLVKDSSSGSRNIEPQAPEFGYYFFTEDYVKLKIMDFIIHKDAVKDVLLKFN